MFENVIILRPVLRRFASAAAAFRFGTFSAAKVRLFLLCSKRFGKNLQLKMLFRLSLIVKY